MPIPNLADEMTAAVYRGRGRIEIERVPTPAPGPGEILVRVACCGICHTDLKKIEQDLLPPPRIYGHETAGTVAAVGEGVDRFRVGDRVAVFHHIPCLDCFYCARRDYAQCERYKQVGVTAGFEPAGGGFAEYVRVMDWIVERGVVTIPDGVSFEQATFIEPVNTCLKGLEKCRLRADESVLILGQGPIGLLFTMLLAREGAVQIWAADLLEDRLAKALRLGAAGVWNASESNVAALMRAETDGRGADCVIVAASAPGIVEQAVAAARPGGRIMLFAQTSPDERFTLDGAVLGKGERTIFGSYSASVDLQQKSADIVCSADFPVEQLISHRLPLREIARGIELARTPSAGSLKILISPDGPA